MGTASSRLSAGSNNYDGRYSARHAGGGQYMRRRRGRDRGLSDAENGYSDHHLPPGEYLNDDGTDSDDDSEYESLSEDEEYAEADELNDEDGDVSYQQRGRGRPYDRRGTANGRGLFNYQRWSNHQQPLSNDRGGGGGGWASRALDTVTRMRPSFSTSFERARSAVNGGRSRHSFQSSFHRHPQRHQRYQFSPRNSRNPTLADHPPRSRFAAYYRSQAASRHRFGYGRRRRANNSRREVRHGYDYHPIYFGPAFRPVVEQSPEQLQLQRLLEYQLEQQQREDLQRRRERQQRRQQQRLEQQLQHHQRAATGQDDLSSPVSPYPSHPNSHHRDSSAMTTSPSHVQKDKLLYYRNNHLYNLISGLSVNPLLTEIQKAGTLDLKSLEKELVDVEGGWVDMDDEEESDEDRQELTEEEEYLRKQGIAREMQPTKRSPTALACPVNLKKSTIRLVKNLSPLAPSKSSSADTNNAGTNWKASPGGGEGNPNDLDPDSSTGGSSHYQSPLPQNRFHQQQQQQPFQQSVLGLPSYRLDFMFDSQTPCDIKLFWVTKEVEELIMAEPDSDDDDAEEGDGKGEESTAVFLGFRLKRLFHLPQPTVYHFDAGLNQRFVSPILPLYNLSLPELTMQGLPSTAMRVLEKQRYREERRWRQRRQQQQIGQQRNQQRGARRPLATPAGDEGGAAGTGGNEAWEEAEYLVDLEHDSRRTGGGEHGHSTDLWETDSEDEFGGLDGSSDFSLSKPGLELSGQHREGDRLRSTYSPKKLPMEDQYYPLIIVIEARSQAGDPHDSKTLACDTPGLYLIENQAISTFCSFHISTEGGFELKVMKQKVWINSNHYLIQEIYGFTDASPSTTPAAAAAATLAANGGGSSPLPPLSLPTHPSTLSNGRSGGASFPNAPEPAALLRDSLGRAVSSSFQRSSVTPATSNSSDNDHHNLQGLGIIKDDGGIIDNNSDDNAYFQFTRTSATPLSASEYREQQEAEAKVKRLSRSLSKQSRAESVMARMTELLSEPAVAPASSTLEPAQDLSLASVLESSALPQRPSWGSQQIEDIEERRGPGSSSTSSQQISIEDESKDIGHDDNVVAVQRRLSASTLLGSEAPSSPSRHSGPDMILDESSLSTAGRQNHHLGNRASTTSIGSTALSADASTTASTPAAPRSTMAKMAVDDQVAADLSGSHTLLSSRPESESFGDNTRNLTSGTVSATAAPVSPIPLLPPEQQHLQPQAPVQQPPVQQQQQAQVDTVLLDAPECVICLSDVKDTLVLPCRHFCICNECADVLRRRTPQRCPICRQEFHALIHLASVPSTKNFFFESVRSSIEEEDEEEYGVEAEGGQAYCGEQHEGHAHHQHQFQQSDAPSHTISFSPSHTVIRA